VLLNGSMLNVLSLEGLGLPRWRLSVGWDKWLELGWPERVGERISPKTGVLPSWGGMVHGTSRFLLLPFFLKNSFESFLVRAVV
jgi:hypothetical protein